MNRRKFFKKSVIGSASLMTLNGFGNQKAWAFNKVDIKPAILGGEKSFTGQWPKWPIWNPATDEKQLLEVMRSGVWSRSEVTDEFEKNGHSCWVLNAAWQLSMEPMH